MSWLENDGLQHIFYGKREPGQRGGEISSSPPPKIEYQGPSTMEEGLLSVRGLNYRIVEKLKTWTLHSWLPRLREVPLKVY